MALSQLQHVSWEETQYLIDNLHAWGITYLTGGTGATIQPLPPTDFIYQLAVCEDSRVHYAAISAFLLHPDLADAIDNVMRENATSVSEEIAILTLATLYLQRRWRIRLTLAMGHSPHFPETPFCHLWEERHLPPPATCDGTWGLRALEAYQQQRSGLPIQYRGDWDNQINHFCYQEEAKHHNENGIAATLIEQGEAWEEHSMSMRPAVSQADIENFLRVLGRSVRQPAQIYLVGGAALVHKGVRVGTTQDIDVKVGAQNEQELVNALHKLAQTYNVEFASPGDFIPLPQHEQSQYVGRYGDIDVFYYDFVILALSKIARGQDRDFRDIKLLVQQGIITLAQLETAYQEIYPRIGQIPFTRISQHQYAQRFAALKQLLHSA